MKIENKFKDQFWHKWFAWYPVPVRGKWVWLEFVGRHISKNAYDQTVVIYDNLAEI